MSGLDPRAPVGDIDRIAYDLGKIRARLDLLEAPSGTQAYRAVEKLTALVDDIQAQLDDYIANDAYTKAQVDAKVASPGAIAPSSVNASGSLTVGGATQLNGTLRVPDAYGFDITYTRRTAWWGNDGRAGYASSSATKKCAIRPADIDPNAVLTLEPRSFYYRREIERRTQMRIDGLGDYVPKREVGLLAQELDALGLGWLVYYDEGGNAEGIEYSMLTVALLAVARSEHAARLAIETRLTALEEAHG